MEEKWPWVIGGLLAVVGAIWWYNTQSSAVAMDDGVYACQVVYVNSSDKYQVVTSGGQTFEGYLDVQDGEVVELSAPREVLEWSRRPDLSYDNKGRTHVRVTDSETFWQTRLAFACDHQG